MEKFNIIKMETDNMINGPGFRVVLWFRGCRHHCSECHNPETWSFEHREGDIDITSGKGYEDFHNEISKPYYDGITLTGGCPFCQDLDMLYEFLGDFEEKHPTKTIWCWAGELFEDLAKDPKARRCLEYIDVLVDGPYQKDKRLLTKYCGSTNQRVIDVQQSLLNGSVILWTDKSYD